MAYGAAECSALVSLCFAPAPRTPYASISLLQVARKLQLVHERRRSHPSAQGSAKFRDGLPVFGAPDREPDIVLRARRYPVAQAERRKDACGAPRYRPGSRNRDHGHPHPERIAGRSAAAVRCRIQRHVNVIERAKVIGAPYTRKSRDPARGNSRLLEIPDQSVADRALRDPGKARSATD